MKNDNNGNQELEKLLKDKMEELSSTVDCFEKISAKAFPEKDADFYESEFTVSDLENITGRSRQTSVIKWIAAAAAVAMGIAFIPKSAIVNDFFANLDGSSGQKIYQELIDEIKYETENFQYTVFDVPLDYYIQNDVLVTPLLSCPFEESGRTDMKVRLFIKNISDFPTNQVYAVEYSGEYTDINFCAAAESDASFTAEEISSLSGLYWNKYETYTNQTIENQFRDDDGYTILLYKDDIPVSLAAFETDSIFKDENGIKAVTTSIIYGHEYARESEEYFYDMINFSDGQEIILTDRDRMWRTSVYKNGRSALPEENNSSFELTELFGSSEENTEYTPCYAYLRIDDSSPDYAFPYGEMIKLCITNRYSINQGYFCNIPAPSYRSPSQNLKIYFSPYEYFNSYSQAYDNDILTLDAVSKSGNFRQSFTYEDVILSSAFIEYYSEETENQISYIEKQISETETEIKELEKKTDDESAEMLQNRNLYLESLTICHESLIEEYEKFQLLIKENEEGTENTVISLK